MKRFGIRLLTAVAASSMIVTPVMAAPSVDDLESDKAAAQSEVSSLQAQLTDLLTKIGDLEADLISKGEEVIQAQEDLEEAEAKEKQQYEDMKLRIKYMYEQGGSSALETLIASESFSDFVNKAEYIQNVHTYDRQMLDEYVATTKQIEELKTTLEDDQKKMESMQTEYEAQEAELSQTIESKKDEVANLDAQIQAAAEEAARQAAEQQEKRQQTITAETTAAEIMAALQITAVEQQADPQAEALEAAQAVVPAMQAAVIPLSHRRL